MFSYPRVFLAATSALAAASTLGTSRCQAQNCIVAGPGAMVVWQANMLPAPQPAATAPAAAAPNPNPAGKSSAVAVTILKVDAVAKAAPDGAELVAASMPTMANLVVKETGLKIAMGRLKYINFDTDASGAGDISYWSGDGTKSYVVHGTPDSLGILEENKASGAVLPVDPKTVKAIQFPPQPAKPKP
jgi:hypothetical protein